MYLNELLTIKKKKFYGILCFTVFFFNVNNTMSIAYVKILSFNIT